MKLLEATDLYNLISRGSENVAARNEAREIRKIALESASGLKKVAFDTRRIDQETEYNPRRGLQYYNRSEPFISEAMGQKIANFSKLRGVLNGIKEVYGKEPEWQDSNARVLLATLDKGLRVGIDDGDFTENQRGVGGLDYIDQLMYVRYRLSSDDLDRMSDLELRKAILSKDEELTHRYGVIADSGSKKVVGNVGTDAAKKADVIPAPIRKINDEERREITKTDVANQSYDSLVDKLFGNVKASAESPEIERTVTITIKDSIVK
jgi:hypothetical protein